MWLERFVIVIQSLSQDFLPSSWGIYRPTVWDWAVLAGTIGLFTFLMLLFLRLLPMISMSEVRRMLPAAAIRPEPEREQAARLVESGPEEVPLS
jgi:molybdopterin-containing oxidoreductase family membrane subunit